MKKPDYEALLHKQMRNIIKWIDDNPQAFYRTDMRLQRYRYLAGAEIILNTLGWFPGGKLDYQTKTKEVMVFPFIYRTREVKETYEELILRHVKTYKEKNLKEYNECNN